MLEFAEPVLFLFSVGAVCCFSTESHSGVSLLSQAQIRTRGNMACYHGFSYRKIDKIGLSNEFRFIASVLPLWSLPTKPVRVPKQSTDRQQIT